MVFSLVRHIFLNPTSHHLKGMWSNGKGASSGNRMLARATEGTAKFRYGEMRVRAPLCPDLSFFLPCCVEHVYT